MKYVKPDVYVERFKANDAVASGDCSVTIDGNCIIGGQEVSTAQDYFYYTVNDTSYIFWYDPSSISSGGSGGGRPGDGQSSSSGQPSPADEAIILAALEATSRREDMMGWHYAYSKDADVGSWTTPSS